MPRLVRSHEALTAVASEYRLPATHIMVARMNILHVVDSLEFGGLERVVTDLAIEQKRRGDHVAVFSLQATQGLMPVLQDAGIEVVVGNKQGTADFRVLYQLRKLVRRRQINIVHAHNFVPSYYSAVATVAMLKRPVQVVTCHDMGFRLSNQRLRRLFQWSLHRTAGVAMVGQLVHDRYVKDGFVAAHDTVTVLNGIPVERFAASSARRAEARTRLGVAADELVIGTSGRLVELKNQRLLIELMPELRHRFPNLRLILMGGGPLFEELQALAVRLGVADCVSILGHRSDVADLILGLDVFVLPSRTEGLSIALLEACAATLPVVATDVGGNPEIIVDGVTGLLVSADDKPATAAALIRLLADSELRQRLALAACNWVREHASVESLAATYDDFYRRYL